MKRCSTCKESLPLTSFVRSPAHKDGYHGVCKPCRNAQRKAKGRTTTPEQNRQYSLKSMYGITPQEYDALYAAQQGRCKICGVDEAKASRGKLFVDHHHLTGAVRGLLCHHCNAGLGLFRDSPELLDAAKTYLAGY